MRRAGGWARRTLLLVGLLSCLAGCTDSSPGPYTGNPIHYLITVDQLLEPNFSASSTAALVDASVLASGDLAAAAALSHDGLHAAARVEFQRAEDFTVANGPIDIVATVERFGADAGASSAYAADVRQLDGLPGATPISTGPLGDEAHAISVVKTTSGGLSAVEITIEWRVGNLVNIIVARGRYGGTRLDDVLVLANRQTANEVSVPGS